MANILATIFFAIIIFTFFIVALSLGRLLGRQRKRRCACAEAKAVMREFDAREKAARKAVLYRPEAVNAQDLPILSLDLDPQHLAQTSSTRK